MLNVAVATNEALDLIALEEDSQADKVSVANQSRLERPRLSRVFPRIKTTTIMATTYPTLRAAVPGYVFEGFTVLAGRQKLGKTWLAIDWSLAVATGTVAMGSIRCEQGDVLYVDMEKAKPP